MNSRCFFVQDGCIERGCRGWRQEDQHWCWRKGRYRRGWKVLLVTVSVQCAVCEEVGERGFATRQ